VRFGFLIPMRRPSRVPSWSESGNRSATTSCCCQAHMLLDGSLIEDNFLPDGRRFYWCFAKRVVGQGAMMSSS
jgi:hypothetical protein